MDAVLERLLLILRAKNFVSDVDILFVANGIESVKKV